MTDIFIKVGNLGTETDTQADNVKHTGEGGGHVTEMIYLQAKECHCMSANIRSCRRQGRILPWSYWREYGLANILLSTPGFQNGE
jgi:hypothetical protein